MNNKPICPDCRKFVKFIEEREIGNTGIKEPIFKCKTHGELNSLEIEWLFEEDDIEW